MRCIRRNQVAGLVVARGILLPRRISLFVFYAVLILTISACSLDGADPKINRAAAPPSTTAKSVETIKAMPTAMDTFRALAPPEGLKFAPLFAEPVADTDARIKRIEDAVQLVRNDFDTVVPTMVRLAAIEKDIKGLVGQLQALTDQSQAPALPAPEVEPEQLPPEANGGSKIPGEDGAKGTDPAKADTAKAGPDASASLVTPEAASKGELPPEGAASPSSNTPVDLKPQVPSATTPMTPKAAATETKPAAPVVPAEKEKPAPSVAVPPPAAVAKPEVKDDKKAEAPAAPKNPAAGDVNNIRIADHADKTRVVLDMSVKADVTAKVENNGKTLIIPLSQLNWLGKKAWDADSAQLISGYHIEEGNLHVDLMYASQIKTQAVLAPSGDSKNYRLMIDLVSPEVHQQQ